MSKSNFKLTLNNVLTCLAYAAIGLLLIVLKAGSLGILMTVVGLLIAFLGVTDIANKETVKGVIETVLGLVLLICGWTIADFVLLVFGLILIVISVVEIVENYKAGIRALLSPVVTAVLGIVLVVAKWKFMDILCIVAGVIFLVNAVLALFGKSITKK